MGSEKERLRGQPSWRPWLLGLMPLAATVVLRALLEPVLEDKSPFLLFTAAVMAAGVYGGTRVAATATFAGAVAGLAILWKSDVGLQGLFQSGRWLQPLLYLLVCGGLTWMVRMMARDRQRARDQAAEQSALAARLKEAARANDEFVATLSHELRTPLTAISGWTEILRRGAQDGTELAHAIDVIRRNVRSQEQIISDLLDVARITSGKIRLAPRQVDVVDCIDAAIETVRPAAVSKRIHFDVHAHEAALVWADSDRLQQVFWNLLSNAVKFTPAGGRVRVGMAATADEARITIADSGPGLQPDLIPHVFERFRQGEGTATRSKGGLGLGLAIVKDLVELHGGAVRAGNGETGWGARFEVALPRLQTAGEASPPEADGEESGAKPLSDVYVLIVDDEDDTREVVGMVLESRGARVRSARSVDEALRVLEHKTPDVVLTDLAMPGQDGFELLRTLRGRPPAGAQPIPVAAVTAMASASDRARTRQAGFQAHVAKPVDPDELTRTVCRPAGR